ncbi:hypothetical protein, partial [Salmonella enterica]|uniref:hypothetical protein n=1 Tax=Salmonella enterica TaxID=28901 RepID=UPI001C4092F1
RANPVSGENWKVTPSAAPTLARLTHLPLDIFEWLDHSFPAAHIPDLLLYSQGAFYLICGGLLSGDGIMDEVLITEELF